MGIALDKLPLKLRERVIQQLNADNEGKGSKLECLAKHESVGKGEAKAHHSGFLDVVVTSFRRRLLDEDNLAVKWHVDALRYAGILYQDSPDRVSIKANQIKVKSKEEERTEITITQRHEPSQI